ncbi:MAG: DUF1501 domain-containing protein [Phycisphaerae bacterium]|nr:DUF1501 domain-containing protein [Phycisphaerae bacterium]
MDPIRQRQAMMTRRYLLGRTAGCLGAASLASLVGRSQAGALPVPADLKIAHFAPKAKRAIYLFFSGGPSHIDMYDYHPKMREFHGKELPASIRQGQRVSGMTSGQKTFPCVAPMFNFKKYGEHQTWVNADLLPHVASIVDDITIIKSVNSESINHDPGITYINTGTQQPGKPSMGSWLSYGLGSLNENLPAYVVMISKGKGQSQALYSRLWGSGFLPSEHQGVKMRSGKDPVLYLTDPSGIDRDTRRNMLDALRKANEEEFEAAGDPETQARISQYEMAYRMQSSVPELFDTSSEPASTFELYGPDSKKPGTYASNVVLGRRMLERGVRFVQLFHRGWDQHGSLPGKIRGQCKDIDQATAGLIKDLKQRGMLEDTLVICGGEFGRGIYSQGKLSKTNHGRDHHGRCFTTWMAGAGMKAGFEYGKTDDYAYNIVENPVHINDLNATILHNLGVDHERLTYKYLGLEQRLTGVESPRVVTEVLA